MCDDDFDRELDSVLTVCVSSSTFISDQPTTRSSYLLRVFLYVIDHWFYMKIIFNFTVLVFHTIPHFPKLNSKFLLIKSWFWNWVELRLCTRSLSVLWWSRSYNVILVFIVDQVIKIYRHFDQMVMVYRSGNIVNIMWRCLFVTRSY